MTFCPLGLGDWLFVEQTGDFSDILTVYVFTSPIFNGHEITQGQF